MNTFRASLCAAMIWLVFGLAAAQQEPTFNAESNVVLVPTRVRDANGEVVYGLQAKDFIVEDDGVEQAPYLDEAAEAGPLSVVVAVQCRRRARREFARMRGFGSMLEPVLSQPGTETALVFFDSKLTLARDFTSNAELIEEDLRNLQPSDGGGFSTRWPTR